MSGDVTHEGFAQRERALFYVRLLWLFPLAYGCHILEELNGFPAWVNGVLHGHFSLLLFCLANAWFMLVLIAITALAGRRRNSAALGLLFFWASGQLFWDAILHIYAENRFAAYSPGFFTAVFLYVPTYAYLTYVALREGFLSPLAWAFGFCAGALLLLLVVWAGLYHFDPIPWSLWGLRL